MAISRHLYYELDMMFFSASAYSSCLDYDKRLGDSILESFVLHFRVVFDFFYSDSCRADDAIAYDFFDDPDEWRRARGEASEELRNSKIKANKDLAHLTYARLGRSYEGKLWQVIIVVQELSLTMSKFLEHVAKEKLAVEWQNAPAMLGPQLINRILQQGETIQAVNMPSLP